MSRHSTPITRHCEVCRKAFRTFNYRIQRGRGKYCSHSCQGVASSIPVEVRFFDYIGKKTTNGCILWNGAICKNGYGYLRDGGVTSLAHRIAWKLLRGPIPDGLFVLHSCDNPPCVNAISHLFLGTPADNNADMAAKGRSTRGERSAQAKLTEAIVREIREAASRGVTQQRLAEKYSVRSSAISRIVTGKRWGHIV
jgi:hypothetical protein